MRTPSTDAPKWEIDAWCDHVSDQLNPGHKGTGLVHEYTGEYAVRCECNWQSSWFTYSPRADMAYCEHYDKAPCNHGDDECHCGRDFMEDNEL